MHESPKLVEWISARVNGLEGHRLMVVLAAPGCHWASQSGGCTNCSFPSFFGVDEPVERRAYERQMDAALATMPADPVGPVQLDLYVSGSFFCVEEVPADAQEALLRRAAAAPGVCRIVVETRPEYVDLATAERARHAVGDVPLEVAIGLETADDAIRLERIRKGFSWANFVDSARILVASGLQPSVHLLLKPIDTTEGEAVADAVTSIERVATLAQEVGQTIHISLQPCFVAPDTPLETAFDQGRYRPPWLWSVIEVIRRTADLAPIHVGLSDEGMGVARSAHNCPDCTDTILTALAGYNRSGDSAGLEALECHCVSSWQRAMATASNTPPLCRP